MTMNDVDNFYEALWLSSISLGKDLSKAVLTFPPPKLASLKSRVSAVSDSIKGYRESSKTKNTLYKCFKVI